MQQTKTVCV